MNTLTQQKVGDLVREDLNLAKIFSEFEIDYCCGGRKTLETSCAEKNIDLNAVIQAIESHRSCHENYCHQNKIDFNLMTLAELVDHVIDTHHVYLYDAFPHIHQLLNKVTNKHGNVHPELFELQKIYHTFRLELEQHMQKEEGILFPAIQSLEKNTGTIFAWLQSPIAVMLSEHEQAGEALRMMRKITNDYQLPKDACKSYLVLFRDLQQLEKDLHLHIHKENNILFPKVVQRI